jgi:hypothetical protein
MKKIFWACGVFLLMGLVFATSSKAKVYTVERGDCLTKIAEKELGSFRRFKEIERLKKGKKVQIPGPKYSIRIGEKLWIPDSTTMTKKRSAKKDFKRAPVKSSVKPATSVKKTSVDEKTVASKVVPSGASNVSQAIRKANQKEVSPRMVVFEKNPSKEKKTTIKVRNVFDAIDTANVSYSRYGSMPGEDRERNGWNFGLTARWRPLKVSNFLGGSLRIGAYGKYNFGESEVYKKSNGRTSNYDYFQYGGGLSLEQKYKGINIDFDIGFLKYQVDGKTPAKNFTSKQTGTLLDTRLWFKDERRRLKGDKWFPKWEAGIRYQHPLSTDYQDSRGQISSYDEYEYDHTRLDFGGNLWIYDIQLDEDENWFLTPGINLHLGKSWGKDSFYIKGGPSVVLGAYKQEPLQAEFLNPMKYFNGNGSRIYWFSILWRVDDTIRAIRASQIQDYDPDAEEAEVKEQKSSTTERSFSSVETNDYVRWDKTGDYETNPNSGEYLS